MKKLFLFTLLIYVSVFPEKSFCQFYKIYGYATPDAGEKELVYWFSCIPSSEQTYMFFGDEIEREGLFAHSMEVEYGLSNKFSMALYLDFEHPRYSDLRWVGTKAVMARYRFFEKASRPVDLAIYTEYKLPKKEYKNAEELELKLIAEKDFGFHTLVANPTFEKKMSGPDIDEGAEFSFNIGYYYKRSLIFQPGIEFYGKMGELRGLSPLNEQENYIFPTVDIFLGPHKKTIWHIGVGFGLTKPADNIILKSIISYGFF